MIYSYFSALSYIKLKPVNLKLGDGNHQPEPEPESEPEPDNFLFWFSGFTDAEVNFLIILDRDFV